MIAKVGVVAQPHDGAQVFVPKFGVSQTNESKQPAWVQCFVRQYGFGVLGQILQRSLLEHQKPAAWPSLRDFGGAVVYAGFQVAQYCLIAPIGTVGKLNRMATLHQTRGLRRNRSRFRD